MILRLYIVIVVTAILRLLIKSDGVFLIACALSGVVLGTLDGINNAKK